MLANQPNVTGLICVDITNQGDNTNQGDSTTRLTLPLVEVFDELLGAPFRDATPSWRRLDELQHRPTGRHTMQVADLHRISAELEDEYRLTVSRLTV